MALVHPIQRTDTTRGLDDAATPLVTVVITTHDRPQQLERAVASALRQQVREIEVVVVDDGSEIPPAIRSQDTRLKVLRSHRSEGVCAARNRGLAVARGRWITFLDDDDELLPHMLATSLKAIERSKLPSPVAVRSCAEEVDMRGDVLRVNGPAPSLTKGKLLALDAQCAKTENTLVAPVDTLRHIGGWDERLRAWEHDDFMLRVNAACSVESIGEVLYRMHDDGGARRSEDWIAFAEAIVRTEQKHRASSAMSRSKRARYLATAGGCYLKAGRWRAAVGTTTKSLLIDPTDRRVLAYFAASLLGPRVALGVRRLYRMRP